MTNSIELKPLNDIKIAHTWIDLASYKNCKDLDAKGWRDELEARLAREKVDEFKLALAERRAVSQKLASSSDAVDREALPPVTSPDGVDIEVLTPATDSDAGDLECLTPVTSLDEIDQFLCRTKAVQVPVDIGSTESRHRILLEVDLYCPDRILSEEFASVVKEEREKRGIDIARRGAGRPRRNEQVPLFDAPSRFQAWCQNRVLQYLDLKYYAELNGYQLSNVQFAEVIFPHMSTDDPLEQSKQISETKRFADQAIGTLRTLQAQLHHGLGR